MQSLKHWAAEYSISVLAVVPSRPRRRPTALSLNDIATGRNIASLADTVFALSTSTFAPDIRYLKHLASPRPITHTAQNVLTFQLGRTPGTQAPPPALRSATEPTEFTEPTALLSPVSPSPDSPSPFLALTFIGTSAEDQHLRDYAAESLAADRAHERELKRLRQRTSKDILVDGILDGSYGKYLKGE